MPGTSLVLFEFDNQIMPSDRKEQAIYLLDDKKKTLYCKMEQDDKEFKVESVKEFMLVPEKNDWTSTFISQKAVLTVKSLAEDALKYQDYDYHKIASQKCEFMLKTPKHYFKDHQSSVECNTESQESICKVVMKIS